MAVKDKAEIDIKAFWYCLILHDKFTSGQIFNLRLSAETNLSLTTHPSLLQNLIT